MGLTFEYIREGDGVHQVGDRKNQLSQVHSLSTGI